MVLMSDKLACEWCENEASYSINWECGHASACCALCFEPSDARDWTMDFADWDADPAECPNCAG